MILKSQKDLLVFLCLLEFISLCRGNSKNTIDKLGQVSTSLSHFSSDFFQVLAAKETNENIVFSPFTIHIILSLLLSGSEGITKEELKFLLNVSDTNEFYKELRNWHAFLQDNDETDLKLANAMYVNSNFILQQDFLLHCKNIFNVDINEFEPQNQDHSASRINEWVKNKTNERISYIIKSDDIEEYTKIIIVNVLYFKNSWLNQFDLNLTEKKNFHNIHQTVTNIPMMSQTFPLLHGYIDSLGAHFIKIQYLNQLFEMIIILPNKKYGLNDLEKKFKWDSVTEAYCSTKEVYLVLPRFSIETMIDLKSILKKMGVNSIFQETANFNLIAEESLHVNKMLQKLFINVDEKGTEATAATVAHIRSRRMIIDTADFVVDHPFMFIINYKPSNIPLFIGSVRNLRSETIRDEL